MFLYGVMPTGGAIFAVAMVHSVFDGLTVSSTGVAVGLTVPADRQAGAQGVLGAAQAMAAGAMAVHHRRAVRGLRPRRPRTRCARW